MTKGGRASNSGASHGLDNFQKTQNASLLEADFLPERSSAQRRVLLVPRLTELFKHFQNPKLGAVQLGPVHRGPKPPAKAVSVHLRFRMQAISRDFYVQATASLALNNQHASPADPWTSSSPQKWPCLSPVAKHMRTQSGQRFTLLLRPGCPPPGREFPYTSMSQAASCIAKKR